MRIRTDDEVYRVDAVWLGPPKATFPWRARYVAWGVGIVVFLLVLMIERRMNIGFSFFSTAWAVIITIAVTRIICAKITHERPLGAVLVMWLRELTAPRETTTPRGGAAGAAKIKVHRDRPRPRHAAAGGSSAARAATSKTRPGKGRRTNKTAGRSRTGARARSSKEVRGVRSPAKP